VNRTFFATVVSFAFSVCSCGSVTTVAAQALTERGFVEGTLFAFPQQAPNDPQRVTGDARFREEVFFKPTTWVQFAGGADLRANSHDQVEDEWRLDFSDRGALRPRASVRRLSATFNHRGFTADIGKQLIRWGKTDIVTPTDRFAPRDFLNVIDAEFLPVTGARASWQHGDDTIEGVWVPRLTPSRVPLFNQRWTVLPPNIASAPVVDAGATIPRGSETGARWSHVGAGFEFALSFFDGFNDLPNIAAVVTPAPLAVRLTRVYPSLRMVGGETAVPTRWFTIKGEVASFTSSSAATDDYVLYVVQIERQAGEWVFVGGYAGQVVTERRAALTFAPDRGLTRSFVGRASYTIDPWRSAAFEAAARQNGDGLYVKGEYSEARGNHWRVTLTGVAIAGHSDDFLGQYRRNSHAALAVRYSF